MEKINRVFLIVLDSVGIGGADDAKNFEFSHAEFRATRTFQHRRNKFLSA